MSMHFLILLIGLWESREARNPKDHLMLSAQSCSQLLINKSVLGAQLTLLLMEKVYLLMTKIQRPKPHLKIKISQERMTSMKRWLLLRLRVAMTNVSYAVNHVQK
ncbi:unnamed protein product [Amaranthus hypochondriacus]